MSGPVIGQADWDALARRYGEVSALLLVYERTLDERGVEIVALREQLAVCADALHAPPDPEGGA